MKTKSHKKAYLDIQNQEKTQGQQQTKRVVQPHLAGAIVSAQ